MQITDFADVIDKEIVIRRYPGQSDRWTAHFERCETKPSKESSILEATYGDSNSPSNALSDYATKLRSKVLVFNAGYEGREEFVAPKNLYHL